jgi:hypothetical protein
MLRAGYKYDQVEQKLVRDDWLPKEVCEKTRHFAGEERTTVFMLCSLRSASGGTSMACNVIARFF